MTCRRIKRMPANCEEKCKEGVASTTNDKNETNHFTERHLIIVVNHCSGAGAAREKSAHAGRGEENRWRRGDRGEKEWCQRCDRRCAGPARRNTVARWRPHNSRGKNDRGDCRKR